MPCYSAWNDYLEPGTPQYEEAKAAVTTKLHAVRHIIDYYYRAHGQQLPQLPDGVILDPFRQPRAPAELALREMICHHFSCDGVNFCTLYDVASLLNVQIPTERAYLAVVLPCATLMRMNKDKFVPAKKVERAALGDA